MPMLIVIDTDVLVAALRSPSGASAELVRLALRGEVIIALSVATVLEYEAVATRQEHLDAAGLEADDALAVVDALAAVAVPVRNHFRWRPQLRDPNDEIVLESAVDAGADAIATFNKRDFTPAAGQFGIDVMLPRDILEKLRSKS
jgi:putative PIN family toxin of toxin-antitoxin system